MPGRKRGSVRRFVRILAALSLGALLVAPALAGEPGWCDVPQPLKHEYGAQRQGEFLYATGMARAAISVRPDKTHEVAQKKSLLRALQLVHMASSCEKLLAGLDREERQAFVRLFAPLAPAIRVEGVTVIRQWEQDRAHFTAVAVPLTALKDLPCEFPDLSTAISRYLSLEQISSAGLAFCLRHASRYSLLSRAIRELAGRCYLEWGPKVLARCFISRQTEDIQISTLEILALQYRLAQAAQLTTQAERLAKQGKWDAALDFASQALDLVPTYARTYLLLADYFLREQKSPVFALCAIEKAMRDGTCLKEALSLTGSCLKNLRSPEAEVYDFLLSQCQPGKEETYPSCWEAEIDRLADAAIPYLVALSVGRAVEGESKSPGAEFGQAVRLFEQAKSDDDVVVVLSLLLLACEKQPASSKTYNLIGACYRHLGKYEMAFPFLWQALTIEPEYDYALTNLGLCCQSLKLKKAARFYFEHDAVRHSTNKWVKESYADFIKD